MKTILVSALVALIMSLGISYFSKPETKSIAAQAEESVYDRVLRTGKIRCSYAVAPPAFIAEPNTQEFSGLDYEVIMAVAQKIGVEVEWTEETGFGTSPAGIAAGRYDMFCTGNWSDARKARQVFFSTPYYYNPAYAVVRADDIRFDSSLDNINQSNIKIIGIDNDPTMWIAQEDYPNAKALSLSGMTSVAEFLESVALKKADVLFNSYAHSKDYLQNNPGKLKVLTQHGHVRLFPIAFELPIGDSKFKNIIDTALTELINSGRIDKILDKYYGADGFSYYPPLRPTPLEK